MIQPSAKSPSFIKRLAKDWLSTGTDIKLVGDNVDKNVRVRDIRSDHRGDMYSMLVPSSISWSFNSEYSE